jgi:tetratricopeptide (TPR) repeat protein/transcriptional regulator with XRE-family HTH domain
VFGALVAANRQRLGLTQEDLADRTGLSVRTIRDIETGRVRVPRRASVRLLADAFGLRGAERDRFRAQAESDGEAEAGRPASSLAGARTPAQGPPQTPAQTPAQGPPRTPRQTPAQLPADVADFTGRHGELDQLDALLGASATDTARSPMLISAVSGTAGVGKTALALHWAHRVRERFPDGQLYLNLRGYDPDRPVTAADALARLLGAMGVGDPPSDEDDRAARYRTETASRRLLIVLDNAASEEQVRPLLPGSASCAVVVTSRDRLSGLVVRDGARRVDLDLLTPAEAVALLRRLIGPRVDHEPAAAAELARLCARLPLALRIAAELAASRPAVPLDDLVVELADDGRRLDRLRAGDDPRSAVTVVFSWSLRHLPPPAARAFRLLGLHPGPDFDVYALAALAGVDLASAREALTALARAHLVHATGPERYGRHDLLRAYATRLATEQPGNEDEGVDAGPALGRLLDYELATAAAAMDVMYPAEAARRPRIASPPTPIRQFSGAEGARDWLDAELPSLVALAAVAARDWPRPTIDLAATLHRHLDGGHHAAAQSIHGSAHDAARHVGDVPAEAHALCGLGFVRLRRGQIDAAAEHFTRALALFEATADDPGQARALTYLARTEHHLGRYEAAFDHHTAALDRFRRTGDEVAETACLTSLAIVARDMGRLEVAMDHFGQVLTLSRRRRDRNEVAYALVQMGRAEAMAGRYEASARHQAEALALYRELGNHTGEAWALVGLGDAATRLGRAEEARVHLRQALDMFHDLGERAFEAWALNGLGEACAAAGQPGEALEHHGAALDLAVSTSARDQQARAHHGRARAHLARGDPDRARDHYLDALTIYSELGSPAADEVRADLAALGRAAPRGPAAGRADQAR